MAAWGQRNGRSTLSDDQVRELRRLVGIGVTHQAAADTFGVSRSTVTNIVNRRRRGNRV